MFLTMLKSKLHCARVTDKSVNYEGSLTIDRNLMDKAGILPHEKILVANMENGARFETYAIPGKRGSGTICLNGATAHLGKRGDRLTVFAFGLVPAARASRLRPLILLLDRRNRPARHADRKGRSGK